MLSAVTVHPLGDRLRLYYLIRFRDRPTDNVLCIAESSDGRDWHRPDLGGTNIVMRSSGHDTGWGMFMPLRILHEPEDAKDPWRMIYWDRLTNSTHSGICLATSTDGLAWTPIGNRPLIDSANDAASIVAARPDREPIRNVRYLLYQQTWKHNPDLPAERDNLKGIHRVISLWTGPAFDARTESGRWIGPVTVLEPDHQDPFDLQHYWLTPFHTRSGYGGLLNCHHTTDQTMDVQYVTSADGWSWRREFDRRPIVPLGEPGRFDCGMVVCSGPPVRWKDETLLFYNGRATVHDGLPRYPDAPLPEPANGVGLIVLGVDILAA